MVKKAIILVLSTFIVINIVGCNNNRQLDKTINTNTSPSITLMPEENIGSHLKSVISTEYTIKNASSRSCKIFYNGKQVAYIEVLGDHTYNSDEIDNIIEISDNQRFQDINKSKSKYSHRNTAFLTFSTVEEKIKEDIREQLHMR